MPSASIYLHERGRNAPKSSQLIAHYHDTSWVFGIAYPDEPDAVPMNKVVL